MLFVESFSRVQVSVFFPPVSNKGYLQCKPQYTDQKVKGNCIQLQLGSFVQLPSLCAVNKPEDPKEE